MDKVEKFLRQFEKCVVYIGGPMTGIPDKGRKAFAEAEKELLQEGYIVLNPAKLPDNMPAERYMPICLAMLEASDAIYMLDGWEASRGAAIERRYAEYQGKTLMYQKTQSADCSWK